MVDRETLDRLKVRPEATVFETTDVLTREQRKIVLVTDADARLLGVVTDYDIRKGILRHVPMDAPVTEIMQPRPIVIPEVSSQPEVLRILRETRVRQIPVVDGLGRVVDIQFADDFEHLAADDEELTAVVMAGGMGTRLRPMTNSIPKPLLQIGDRPILFILLDQLLSENVSRIYLTVNYLGDRIEKAISEEARYRDRVHLVHEPTPLGTAGSLRLLPSRLSRAFIVINGDLLTNFSVREMMRFHKAEKCSLTMATKNVAFTIPYGVVELEGARVHALKEKPSFSYFVNTGAYVVEPAAVDRIPRDLAFDMTDLVNLLLQSGEKVSSFPVHEYWLDIGNHANYEQAQRDIALHFGTNGGVVVDVPVKIK